MISRYYTVKGIPPTPTLIIYYVLLIVIIVRNNQTPAIKITRPTRVKTTTNRI